MKKDLLIILISFLGLIASYYLLIHDIRLESGAEVNSICAINEFIDCDAVSLSVYSKIFGIAVASLGAGYYLSLLLLTTIKLLTASPVIKNFILSTTFMLTAISVITSIFLGYISLFKISALCIFCFFTYFCNIFLFIISTILIKGIKMRQLFSNLFLFINKKIDIRCRQFIIFILFNMLLVMLVNVFAYDFIKRLYGKEAQGVSEKSEKIVETTQSSNTYRNVGNITVVSVEAAYSNFFGKDNVVFIDNRPFQMYGEGHIKGAISLTFKYVGSNENKMTKEKFIEVTKDKTVVLYCSGFTRAYYAAKTIIEDWKFDSTKIFWLQQGFHDWAKMGYPIEKAKIFGVK